MKTSIIIITVGLLGIILGVLVGDLYQPGHAPGDKVNCFDKYGNQIINQTCEYIGLSVEATKIFIGVSATLLFYFTISLFIVIRSLFQAAK